MTAGRSDAGIHRRSIGSRHRTEYSYSDVVTSSYGRGHLTPRDTSGQRCLAYELDIDPVPADRSTSRDVYGNISSYFHITERHDALTVTSRSVVEVDPPPAELYGAGWALAPWEAIRPVGHNGALASEFTLDLRPPEITDAVREYAALSFTPGRPLSKSFATSMPGSSPTSPTSPDPQPCPHR